ncbi:MAG: caspase family protein [Planctomycetaceae bacterium]
MTITRVASFGDFPIFKVLTNWIPAFVVWGIVSPFAAPVQAEDEAGPPQNWAILIGVEKYTKAPPLQYTVNDVKRLSETLLSRHGVSRRHILEITDQRKEAAYQPTKDALMKKLQEWFTKPKERDSIIVYFSGHGFRDAAGKLYLAPLDCDPDNPEPTGIPVEWFRAQLAACPAGFKLLVLDACHAGTEKGAETDSVDANELGTNFEDLERVVTIASSKANEKSLIWDAKEQSLFSYWLNQGLRGHADRDLNGQIDIDELYEFVSRNVKRTADFKFGRSQTPVRLVRFGVEGVPTVSTLKPQSLKDMLADMAEQLAYAMEEQKFPKVGVLEFITQDQTGAEGLGTNFGLLGKYCAEELERQLQDRGTGKFSVVERRRLQESLSSQKFGLKDLGSSERLASLSQTAGGMPVLVVGSLVSRDGRVLRMQCKLQQTESDADLGVTTGGTAALSESEWAMLGRSTVVRAEDRRPDFRPPTETTGNGTADNSIEAQVINSVDQRTEGPASHPFRDPTFQFRVSLVVDGKERKGEFRGNDYFVPVRKGEKYRLVVENKSGEVAVMRLLVDGLNTLPEKEKTKGIVTESWGQHVHLDEARAWILDPQGPEVRGKEPKWVVAGFATATGRDGKLREFVIVDAQESLAGRQGFSEEVGLITAAFYKPKSGARGGGVGTAAGSEIGMDLTERAGVTAGNLIGVVHIRYVEESALTATNN